ncbi:hypothetical protein B0H13DRAFT_2345685 [Mycena leptocephala]|nr:hypothetical protein B0H13DRAFT_2345685 [Mycena leptocephala]
MSYYQFINPSARQYSDWSKWCGLVGFAEPGQQTPYSTLLHWSDGSYMRFPLALDDHNSFVKVLPPEAPPAYTEKDETCPVYAEKEKTCKFHFEKGLRENFAYACLEVERKSRWSKNCTRLFTLMLSWTKGWICCGYGHDFHIQTVEDVLLEVEEQRVRGGYISKSSAPGNTRNYPRFWFSWKDGLKSHSKEIKHFRKSFQLTLPLGFHSWGRWES